MHSESSSLIKAPTAIAELARLFAAAPHRLLFFGGACAVLLAMLWWTLQLIAMRWAWPALPAPATPAGWVHAITMQYQVLALFIFGFLLTVLPRWTATPVYSRAYYVPVAGLIFAGHLATLAGLFGQPALYYTGIATTLLGWSIGTALLLRTLWLDGGRTYHAASCWIALALGGIGLALFAAFLIGGDARFAFAAIKWGTFGFLLPMYLTVCHRMVPFFSQCALADYRMVRPGWVLAAFWLLTLAHLCGELSHAYAWLWPVDLALAGLSAGLLWSWQPWRARRIRLLFALHLAAAWLPIAALLYTAQSAWYAATGEFVLGRVPLHALAVGYFGSMLVAMVTRVTQGHSGRPLEMGPIAWSCFLAMQGVALLRIGAEFSGDATLWYVIAGLAWLLAFAPWVLRSLWIYATPRADGKPG